MGQRDHRVNEPITVLYQAPNKATGQTVVGEIYLPSGSKDSNFPNFTLTERDTTGTYVGSFTPDESGEWQVVIHLDDGSGQVTKRYSVGTYDVTGVGVAVEGVDGKVDTLGSGVATVDGKVTTVDGKVTTVDGKIDTVDGKVDALDTKVSALDTPPMIS